MRGWFRLSEFTGGGIEHIAVDTGSADSPPESILSSIERSRYDILGPLRRGSFLTARAVSKYLIIKKGCGLSPELITTITREGIPAVPEGTGPAPLFISVSHDSRYCMGVISSSPWGCDVETVNERVSRVKGKLLTFREIQLFGDDENQDQLTKIWTIKEAAAKRFGISMLTAMNTVAVTEVSESVSRYTYNKAEYRAVHAELEGHVFTVTA